ncbi:MAG: hypothetical protein Q9201_004674 [Fulgogasparrea decipioides]
MGLVDYSESEGSGEDDLKQASSKSQSTNKPAFQKVVDRSNPHKIRVSLPESAKASPEDREAEDGPPAKKPRVGGGAFSGFNSLLPAPKRPSAHTGGAQGAGSKRGGFGTGVSLKTGSAPGFNREPAPEPIQDSDKDVERVDGNGSLEDKADAENITSTEKERLPHVARPPAMEKAKDESKKPGNPMMFKPLSVARKPQKKNSNVTNGDAVAKPQENRPSPQPKPMPKVSLFSAEPAQNHDSNGISGSNVTYQPILYGASEPEPPAAEASQIDNPYIGEATASVEPPPQTNKAPGPQSLDSIASDLNLSASAKRQLFGRQRGTNSTATTAINVVNFNTDQEYAANELLRQAGEQIQHNPVRAIAPGKHSLKQLVNAASNQKDALEEQFASGRRNKKEAGNKYGW